MKNILVLLLAFSTQIFAQVNPELSSTKTLHILEGTINNKYPITMHLTIEENTKKVKGQYYYNNVGTPIYLGESILDQNAKLNLKEFENEYSSSESTGQFTGTFDKNKVFKGTWSNGKKSFVFEVKPNKNSIIQEMEIKEYTLNKQPDPSYSSPEEIAISEEIFQIINPKRLASINVINKTLEKSYFLEENDTNDYYLYWIEGWEFFQSSDFVYSDNNIISLNTTLVYYTGGVGTLIESSPTVYSLNTGKALTINDLIYSVDDTKLVALLQQKLIEYTGDSPGYFEGARLPYDYSIDASGITFMYSKGTIAANVYGIIEISFTFDELNPFVRKDSELYYLFE